MDKLFNRFYEIAFHSILGIVAASTIAILPYRFANINEFVISLLFAAGGFAVSCVCDRLLVKSVSDN